MERVSSTTSLATCLAARSSARRGGRGDGRVRLYLGGRRGRRRAGRRAGRLPTRCSSGTPSAARRGWRAAAAGSAARTGACLMPLSRARARALTTAWPLHAATEHERPFSRSRRPPPPVAVAPLQTVSSREERGATRVTTVLDHEHAVGTRTPGSIELRVCFLLSSAAGVSVRLAPPTLERGSRPRWFTRRDRKPRARVLNPGVVVLTKSLGQRNSATSTHAATRA